MNNRWLLTLLIGASIFCAGQPTATFYLKKDRFAKGEPVVLYYEITNPGPAAVNVYQADPYSYCSGYTIHLSSDPSPSDGCGDKFVGGSCLSSAALLAPTKSRTEQILLNFDHKLDQTGSYYVEASRSMKYADDQIPFFQQKGSSLDTQATLHFEVDESAEVDPALWITLKSQLKSNDPLTKIEAARALASLAPSSMEDTLLTFKDDDQFKQFAPLAFSKLKSERSLSALAEMLVRSQPGTNESLESSHYLAQSHDRKWFRLLSQMAEQHPEICNYVFDAASMGGDDAIELLLKLSRSPDKQSSAVNGVSALGYTGSRAAVPILLEFLRGSDDISAERAVYGLRQLTHMTVSRERWNENPRSQYQRWLSWWNQNQNSAHIYKEGECGEYKILP